MLDCKKHKLDSLFLLLRVKCDRRPPLIVMVSEKGQNISLLQIQLFPLYNKNRPGCVGKLHTAVSVIVDILSLIQVAEENFTAVSNLQELSLGAPLSHSWYFWKGMCEHQI